MRSCTDDAVVVRIRCLEWGYADNCACVRICSCLCNWHMPMCAAKRQLSTLGTTSRLLAELLKDSTYLWCGVFDLSLETYIKGRKLQLSSYFVIVCACLFSARASLEALVAVAVQAYAELNRSREVLPFVAQTYNGIEDCPALIAHLW